MHMKKMLIASFDMEVGGVERSLISMLNNLDYEYYQVDLMLYSHTGDFMELLPAGPHLLEESPIYKTFRMSVKEVIFKGNMLLAVSRILAKCRSLLSRSAEKGYRQMQYMWKYALPFLPSMEKEYDVAISYLWPHYFVADKVQAKTKIAWIHTDFSTIDTDENVDMDMWKKFDSIIAVSEDCKSAFIAKYPPLTKKVVVIENIMHPEFIRKQAEETADNPMKEDSRFKIITVARLSYAKGIDQAIEAMHLLRQRGYEDIAWYVVGYGGDEPQLRQQISERGLEGSFHLLGKKINPYPYMKAADLYVQPSRYEGKAVTVTEAQVLGKPVMITNYPTAASQLREGVDGFICELSPAGIADGIEELYKDIPARNLLMKNCQTETYRNKKEIETFYETLNSRKEVH